jgi:hypothetical protein
MHTVTWNPNNKMKMKKINVQCNLSKPNPFRTEGFVWFMQVFGLHRIKMHWNWCEWTSEDVWFRQVSGLFRVRFIQDSLYIVIVYIKYMYAFFYFHLLFIWISSHCDKRFIIFFCHFMLNQIYMYLSNWW